MKQVIIYTDGACLGNPGPGGWCAIATYNGREKIFSGSEANTTNNRMELISVIEGLKALKESCSAEIVSDSKYVTEAFNCNWIYSWQAKGWRKSDGKPVKNQELWIELSSLCEFHKVKFTHIKGHNGHIYNERCDSVARDEATQLRDNQPENEPE